MESSHFANGCVAPRSVRVLNALRHQWNPHKIRLVEAIARASVLNALRHQWNPHTFGAVLVSATFRSAQRLAASMESSPGAGAGGVRPARVLNALRHQWNPHPSSAGSASL